MDSKSDDKEARLGIGVGFGLMFGIALGMSVDRFVISTSIGLALGLAFDISTNYKQQTEAKRKKMKRALIIGGIAIVLASIALLILKLNQA